MITTFKYTNKKNETETRRVLVIHQNKDFVQGFDLKKLNRKEQNTIKKVFGEHKVSNVKFNGVLDYNKLSEVGINKDMVSRSFRNFTTNRIH